jgi:flagellar FliL protein
MEVHLAEAALPQDAAPNRKSKLPLLIGAALFLLCGGGGFYAVYTGLLFGEGAAPAAETAAEGTPGLAEISFVTIAPLVISVGDTAAARHLKFASSLEVTKASEAQVNELMPRILDVMNGYLRAVDPKDLEDTAALVRLRAQLLRRIQLVTGGGRVRDLLVTEFVLD